MTKHITRFHIDKFRGVEDLNLNNLNDINIITGDNNTGKTSILENINYLSGIDSIRNLAFSTIRGIKYPSMQTLSPYERIEYLFPIDDNCNCIHYSFRKEDNYDVIIKKKKFFELLPESEVKKMQGYSVANKIVQEEMIDTENINLEFILNNRKIKEETVSEYDRIIRDQTNCKIVDTVYITPFKHAMNDMYLTNVLNNAELYQEMLYVLKEFDEEILSINADSNEHIGARKRYMILSKNHKNAIPLELYGDGMKKAILLMSAVISAKNGILLLDEFETAIHTSAMDKVFTWILNTCIKLNVQLFITSHSKEAIEKVLKCSPKLSGNINLYTLYKKHNKTVVRTLTCNDAVEALDKFNLELR